jgi:hypothetical protein
MRFKNCSSLELEFCGFHRDEFEKYCHQECDAMHIRTEFFFRDEDKENKNEQIFLNNE